MTPSPIRSPAAAMLGMGILGGALAVNLIASPALLALGATLLTAAALAPPVAGLDDADWAGRLTARLSEAVGRRWPGFRIRSDRDTRRRVFAFLAGVNIAIFGAFFLRAGA